MPGAAVGESHPAGIDVRIAPLLLRQGYGNRRPAASLGAGLPPGAPASPVMARPAITGDRPTGRRTLTFWRSLRGRRRHVFVGGRSEDCRLRSRFRSDSGRPRRSTPSWCSKSKARNISWLSSGSLRAHLRHQPIEMRCAAGIDQDQLAVEDRRLRGQLAEGLGHAGQPNMDPGVRSSGADGCGSLLCSVMGVVFCQSGRKVKKLKLPKRRSTILG
jgi:hypothetical protein